MTPCSTPPIRHRALGRVRGMSLLELMVGMTIGLVVSVAAVGTLVFMQRSERLGGETSRMQQDATLAFNLMGQYLRSSGSVGLSQLPDGGITFNSLATFEGIPGSGGATVRGVQQSGRDVLQSAVSTLRDTGINGPHIDCLGNTVPATVNTVLTVFDWVAASQELRCGRGAVPGDTGAAPQPIVGRVAQFVVHFGVRQGGNVQYRLQSTISDTDWPLVNSVRVCLILTSQGPADDFHNIFRDTPGLAFDDCDPNDAAVINRDTVVNDPQRRMYRLYRQVFTIRPANA